MLLGWPNWYHSIVWSWRLSKLQDNCTTNRNTYRTTVVLFYFHTDWVLDRFIFTINFIQVNFKCALSKGSLHTQYSIRSKLKIVFLKRVEKHQVLGVSIVKLCISVLFVTKKLPFKDTPKKIEYFWIHMDNKLDMLLSKWKAYATFLVTYCIYSQNMFRVLRLVQTVQRCIFLCACTSRFGKITFKTN